MKNKLVIKQIMNEIKKSLGEFNLYIKDLNKLNSVVSRLNKDIIKIDTILKDEQINCAKKKYK